MSEEGAAEADAAAWGRLTSASKLRSAPTALREVEGRRDGREAHREPGDARRRAGSPDDGERAALPPRRGAAADGDGGQGPLFGDFFRSKRNAVRIPKASYRKRKASHRREREQAPHQQTPGANTTENGSAATAVFGDFGECLGCLGCF